MTANLFLLHFLTPTSLVRDPTMNIRSKLRTLPLLIPVAAAGLLTVPLASLAVLPVAPWAPRVRSITLTQAIPTVVTSEGNAEEAAGASTFFKSNLKKNGQAFGTLSGRITTHDVVDNDANFEVRVRQLIFELPGGQVIAMGTSTYPTGPDFVPLEVGDSVTIAITGGTGDYFGANGELVTTRRADGTYRQVLRLAQD
jgi:hypothetical protein